MFDFEFVLNICHNWISNYNVDLTEILDVVGYPSHLK